MGPTTLFDKSFFQSLNDDESMWFDNFFTALIAPVFYVETLSDLAKGPSKRASAEAEVRYIASKFPEMHGTPTINYVDLCIGDLLGNAVPMQGAIPINGRTIKSGNQVGVVFDLPPEVDAFNRWAREEFQEKKLLFCKEYVEMHQNFLDKDMRNIGNIRRSLADCYVDMNDLEICDSLYEAWLQKEPDWGWGWIGWSDSYWLFRRKNKKDLGKALSILERGLAIKGVSDKNHIIDRLNDLKKDMQTTPIS